MHCAVYIQVQHAYIRLCSIWVPWGSRQNLNTQHMQREVAVYSLLDNFIRTFSNVVFGSFYHCNLISSGHKAYWTKVSWAENLFKSHCDISEALFEASVFHSHMDIYLPTLFLVFHPQSPMLTNHERLTPTPQSNSHSSKVTLLY